MAVNISTIPVVVSRIQHRRGTQDQFDALYPPGYTGIGGYDGPSTILQPGEIAVCTDSRRAFMGNLNGEYFEIGSFSGGGGTGGGGPFTSNGQLVAVSVILPPSNTFVSVPGLSFKAAPLHDIVYSVTDSLSSDANSTGAEYTRSGTLHVTALRSTVAPI